MVFERFEWVPNHCTPFNYTSALERNKSDFYFIFIIWMRENWEWNEIAITAELSANKIQTQKRPSAAKDQLIGHVFSARHALVRKHSRSHVQTDHKLGVSVFLSTCCYHENLLNLIKLEFSFIFMCYFRLLSNFAFSFYIHVSYWRYVWAISFSSSAKRAINSPGDNIFVFAEQLDTNETIDFCLFVCVHPENMTMELSITRTSSSRNKTNDFNWK